jgi:hypothetical protein
MDSLSAIQALKFALKHPLTNDREVRTGRYARPTAAALHQRVEKHVPIPDAHDVSSDSGLVQEGGTAAKTSAPFPSQKPRHRVESSVAAPPPRTDDEYNHGYSRVRNKRIAGTFRAGSQKTSASALVLAQLDEILSDINASAGVAVASPSRGGRSRGGDTPARGFTLGFGDIRGGAQPTVPGAAGSTKPFGETMQSKNGGMKHASIDSLGKLHPGIEAMISKTNRALANSL